MKIITKGYYRVVNSSGIEISKHVAFQKALESATNTKSPTILFPDKVVLEFDDNSDTDTTPPSKISIISVK